MCRQGRKTSSSHPRRAFMFPRSIRSEKWHPWNCSLRFLSCRIEQNFYTLFFFFLSFFSSVRDGGNVDRDVSFCTIRCCARIRRPPAGGVLEEERNDRVQFCRGLFNSQDGSPAPRFPSRMVVQKIKIEKNFVFRLLCVLATYIHIYTEKCTVYNRNSSAEEETSSFRQVI